MSVEFRDKKHVALLQASEMPGVTLQEFNIRNRLL